jgi:hypothetical protein
MTAILEPPTTTGPPVADPVTRPLPPVLPAASAPPVLPDPPVAAPPEPREPRARRVLTAMGIRQLGAAMVALFTLEQLLYPTVPGDPPPLTAVQSVVVTVMTVLMLGALAGFVSGRRWALPTALAFSVAEAVNVGLCPVTGHHVIGWWWYAQAALVGVMVVLSGWALTRTRAG